MTPEPDGLDTLTLSRLEELGGAPLLLEIFHLILLHSPDQVAAARAGWESGNLKAVRQAAHSLRSSAGNVGALRLAAAARRLEELAVATTPGEAASVLPALESLESEWTQVRSWLEVRLEQMELGEASS